MKLWKEHQLEEILYSIDNFFKKEYTYCIIGESVPVRMFLGGVDLTPTYKNVASKYTVKYYLNLVLVDEDDRRYFKQQEIQLFRLE